MIEKAIQNELRKDAINFQMQALEGMSPIRVSSTEIAYPVMVGEEVQWVEIKVTLPKGSKDGVPYDGNAKAEKYAAHLIEMLDKAAEKEANKQANLEAKAAAKAEKAKAKAKAEAAE